MSLCHQAPSLAHLGWLHARRAPSPCQINRNPPALQCFTPAGDHFLRAEAFNQK